MVPSLTWNEEAMKFEIYPINVDDGDQSDIRYVKERWKWRYFADGEVIAVGKKKYKSRKKARNAVRDLMLDLAWKQADITVAVEE